MTTYAELYPWLVLTVVCSYFCGNVNFAILISRAKGKDIRSFGSGNPGTMNMMRNVGGKLGILTLILDGFKGFLPAFIAKMIFSQYVIGGFNAGELAMFLAGSAACIGHIYPVTLGFKGGKGVATALGMFIAASPAPALIIFVIGVLFIFVTEYGSFGNMLALAGMSCFEGVRLSNTYYFPGEVLSCDPIPYFITCLLIFGTCFIVWLAHRKNIFNLIFGVEHKTRLRKILLKK
ncbi:MAG: glycerol-3-phosphate 1-O-acyltransferase PlsY [Bacillota bacterium]